MFRQVNKPNRKWGTVTAASTVHVTKITSRKTTRSSAKPALKGCHRPLPAVGQTQASGRQLSALCAPAPPVPRDMKWGHGGQRIECASHGMARCACGSGGGESSCSTSPNTTPLGWACGAQERTQPARRPPSGAQTQLGNPPRVPDQLGSLPRCPQPGGHLTKATG